MVEEGGCGLTGDVGRRSWWMDVLAVTVNLFLRHYLPQLVWAGCWVLYAVLIWRMWGGIHRSTRGLSVLAAMVCLFALMFFVIVFVIGHSSPVAQLNDPSGMSGWRLWLTLFPGMILWHLGVGAVMLVACLCPPYKWRDVVARVLGMLLCVEGLYGLSLLMPDA